MAKKLIKEVDAHVGALVRERRMAVALTQETLGKAIGVTFQQVQKYETGYNRVSSSRLVQIANALGVPPTFFFKGAPTSTKASAASQHQIKEVNDFVASKDGDKLIKAFARLPKEVQQSVVKLVKKIAGNQ